MGERWPPLHAGRVGESGKKLGERVPARNLPARNVGAGKARAGSIKSHPCTPPNPPSIHRPPPAPCSESRILITMRPPGRRPARRGPGKGRRLPGSIQDVHQQSGECIFCILKFDLHILHICCKFCIFWDKLNFFYLTYFAYFFAYSAYFWHILCIFCCIFVCIFCIFYTLICILFAYYLHIICIFYNVFAYLAYYDLHISLHISLHILWHIYEFFVNILHILHILYILHICA
jgi:hypothetical protein